MDPYGFGFLAVSYMLVQWVVVQKWNERSKHLWGGLTTFSEDINNAYFHPSQ